MSVCSPNPVLLSTLLCTISSWNCPGHTFSHPDTSLFLMILVSLMYIIFQAALPVNICLLRVDYKNVLGKAAKEFCSFIFLYITGDDGHQLLPIISQNSSKRHVRADVSQLKGKPGNNFCWNHKPKQGLYV